MTDYVDAEAKATAEIELEVEELEEIIAPNTSSPSIDVETQKLLRERQEVKALRRARALYRC